MPLLKASQPWDTEKVYFEGDDFFSDLIDEIDQAKRSIDIEVYIFDADKAGEMFENALKAAVLRGVKVRLVVDGFGSLTWLLADGWSRADRLSQHVEVRVFHPTPLLSLAWAHRARAQALRWRAFIEGLLRINQRTHRKYWIIDSKIGWVSSMNITQVHMSRFVGPHAWRDTGVRVAGPEVASLDKAFSWAWERSTPWRGQRNWLKILQPSKIPLRSVVRLNHSLKRRAYLYRNLRLRIAKSKEKVWITNPYLLPPTRFLRALKRARKRGVDVRLLVPQANDVFFMRWVITSFYRTLLKGDVRIYEFLPRFIHAKTIVIDSWATVGTSNLNSRSFKHDLEIDVELNKPASIESLKDQFQRDMQLSSEIKMQDTERIKWLMTLGRIVAFFFKNWI